jgi:hypothetical protein
VVEKGLILIFFICISPLITYYRAEGVLGTEAAKIVGKIFVGARVPGGKAADCSESQTSKSWLIGNEIETAFRKQRNRKLA